MSFLYRSNIALRSAAARPSPRLFSTAAVYHKSATETVKDGLKAVDRTVSDVAVKGIDAGSKCRLKATSLRPTYALEQTPLLHSLVPNYTDLYL
jgi:hypothetical protein